MFTYKGRSLWLHVLVLSTLLLPFYFTGCKKVEEPNIEQRDSTMSKASLDSSSINEPDTSDPVDSSIGPDRAKVAAISQSSTEDKDDTPAFKLKSEYSWLGPILIPEPSTYTGLGALVNIYSIFSMFSLAFAAFMLLFALILKALNQSRRIAWVHSCIALIFLLTARPLAFHCELLWGYWVCIGSLVLLLVHDGLGLRSQKG